MSYAYYRFFPGDYIRDTIHLGWLEDCAYRRLIDLYQLHSRPIRNDRAYILRAVRAFEPEQQTAVDNILAEFFTLKADGWHQTRCDAEVRFRTESSENGKNAALARWNKNKDLNAPAMHSQSDRNANQNQNQNQNHKTLAVGTMVNNLTSKLSNPVDKSKSDDKVEFKTEWQWAKHLRLEPRPEEPSADFKGRVRAAIEALATTGDHTARSFVRSRARVVQPDGEVSEANLQTGEKAQGKVAE